MNVVYLAQVVLGAYFLFFGLNGFFNWIKTPQPNPRMFDFIVAVDKTQFLLPLIKVIEIVSGVLLISGIAVNLALILLLPIAFVIILAQLFLNYPKGLDVVFFIAAPIAVIFSTKWSRWLEFLLQK